MYISCVVIISVVCVPTVVGGSLTLYMVHLLVSVWSFWPVSTVSLSLSLSLSGPMAPSSLSPLCSTADINMGIGIGIFSERESDFGDLTILWVYLAFVIFAVVLNSILLLVFTGEAIMKGEKGQLELCWSAVYELNVTHPHTSSGVKLAPAVVKPIFSIICGDSSPPETIEMTQVGDKPSKPDGPPPKKSPAPDSPIRWIALGVFLGVMIPLIVAVIVMIAATGNQS